MLSEDGETVTVVDCVIVPNVAVTVTAVDVDVACAVASPLTSTLSKAGLEEVHVTCCERFEVVLSA